MNIYHCQIQLEEGKDYDTCQDVIYNPIIIKAFEKENYTHFEWEGEIYEAGLSDYDIEGQKDIWIGECIT